MEIEKLIKSKISTNWWICFFCIVILVIFIIVTIVFVLVPLNNIRTQVHEINQTSITAFNLLQTTTSDAESTIKVLDSAATKVNDLEENVLGFIKDVCVLFGSTDFCKNLG
jgi:hypothetical protein